MAAFTAQVESSAALAVDTGFAWLMAPSTNGYRLTRVTIGIVAGVLAPSSQQLVVAINRVSSAGTTPTAGMTPAKSDPNSGAATAVWNTGYATPPTNASDDAIRIALNTTTTVDYWFPDDGPLTVAAGTSNGLAFINRDNALPSSHKYVITAYWAE